MSIIIHLSQGLSAVVDDIDADLAELSWSAAKAHRSFYATRHVYRGDGGRTTQSLHSVIGERLGITGEVDHKDRNGLNDTRGNLRPATRSQNGANQRLHRDNRSGIKGVSWNRRDGVWQAKIQVNGVAKAIGTFEDIEAAEKAVRVAREKIFGDYACHG